MKRPKWKRLICILCILFVMAGTSALATTLQDAESSFLSDGGMEAHFTLAVSAFPSFGKKRLEDLNLLLRHISLHAVQSGSLRQLSVDVDGEDAFRLLTEETVDQTRTLLDLASSGRYVMEGDPLTLWRPSGEETSISGETEELLHIWQTLEAGVSFFSGLPGLCPEEARIQKTNQKLRMGRATQSVSIQLPSETVKEGRVHELIEASAFPELEWLLQGLSFRGKQKVQLLFDEEDRLLKAQYSGQAGREEKPLRNVRLEWKCLRNEKERKDELTLRTPAVDGSERNNWTMSRSWIQEENGTETFSFSGKVDRKGPDEKRVIEWDAQLSGAETVTGRIVWSVTENRETRKTVLIPELTAEGEGNYRGTLEILQYSGKILMTGIKLTGTVCDRTSLSWPASGDESGALEGKDAEEPALNRLIAGALVQRLLALPTEDLRFLSAEIPEADWQQILDANKH